jgi:riboflavin kinase/FMN adenylyltransferase
MNIYRDLKSLPKFDNAVLTIGSFDGMHIGHKKILQKVKKLAQEAQGPSIVITFFPHPRNVIDPGSNKLSVLSTLEEKIDLIAQLGIDHLVVIPFSFEFSRMAPREYIENFLIGRFSPSYIVIGYDHRFGLNRGGDITLLREYKDQFKIIEIPKQELDLNAISSTAIRRAIEIGDLSKANDYLGQAYIISGKVVHGDKLGEKLGYPTANIQVSTTDKLIPAGGIYIVQGIVEDVTFDGMMYIGPRPSIADGLPTVIEVHLLDFAGNIYDKKVNVKVIHRLRGDMKFENLDALAAQMKLDERATRTYLTEHQISTSPASPTKIAIAVLNYNGLDLLESYLPIMDYSSSKYDFEIVVIDNNSTDKSVSYLEEWHPEIKIVELLQNYGFAKGYNKGVAELHTAYTVFLNSDVLVTEKWLDSIIDLMDSDPSIGIVQPVIRSLEEKEKYEYAGAAGGYIDRYGYPFCRGRIFDELETDSGQYPEDADIVWASGAAMVMRTQLFKDLGGFDPMFFAHQEEIDLCIRARRAGYRILCHTGSKVFHLGGGTLSYDHPRKIFYNFRNNLFLITKNERWYTLVWLIPYRLIMDGIAGVHMITQGKWKSTLQIIKAHFAYYGALPSMLESSRQATKNIQKVKIGPSRLTGIYNRSIVWQYFAKGIKTFSRLNPDDFSS